MRVYDQAKLLVDRNSPAGRTNPAWRNNDTMIHAGILVALVAVAPPKHVRLERQLLLGADVSSLSQMESAGAIYRDGGIAKPMLQMMKQKGCNLARVRLWVSPNKSIKEVQDLAYVIDLGRRIKASGMQFLLDFHYSDTWADPGKQFTPSAWANLSAAQLNQKIHDYSRDCILALKAAGAMPDIVQPGNEITNGMLWPTGKLPSGGWPVLGALLKSAIAGIKEAAGASTPKIMIHIDRGGDWPGTKSFFIQLEAQSVPYDLIGLSYYPTYHGPISGLAACLNGAATTFHKPIMVVEAGYPYVASWFPEFHGEFPVTPAGQKAYLQAVIDKVKSTPGKLGIGVVWWEPGWYSVQSNGEWYGGWGQCMVDSSGNALPSWDAFSSARAIAGKG